MISLSKRLSFTLIGILLTFTPINFAKQLSNLKVDSLIGSRVNLPSFWIGKGQINHDVHILVMAGHADSQGMNGAGTSGYVVDLKGAAPMDSSMRDELYWNLLVCKELVLLGRRYGLNISFYDPEIRTLVDANDPRTNWSNGYRHALNGGYPLEIHFDAYGPDGYGSGLIPAVTDDLNSIDESLASDFGRYPLLFRGGLGAPRRQIRILEIGKLEGELEDRLRDASTRDKTIRTIAIRITNSILKGLNKDTITVKL
ncbi:N-acetylmuramoyl-L-alanine amidase [Prochlorococcus sp. MIT 1341]|uniref:N-acetylmuramoyl-L-alanine amidase n=1 Tax=Prochlorococcus sp. MIT 1341 TaxID=3096221 RepID=UPI002A74E6E4|nr:N-acetylmuramoyl-L-alanine amidase [Prochlorococcus sp. MIT 1341]